MPEGKGEWNSCACGLAKGHTEERMAAFVREMEAEMFGGEDDGEEDAGGRGRTGSGRGMERAKDGEVRGRRATRD
jgi:hypothetical protein